MTGPACGNNPNYRMSDGDRRVVESFRTYLAARGALLEAADWYAQQGKTVLAAAQVATDLRRRAGAEACHVDASPVATETDEQRADREETERDHDRGDHTHCGVTCEVELPTEHLRNFVIAKGYPGTKGALAELERRAAAKAAPNVDLPARLLACGFCYEEQGEEVHPHPECPVGRVAPADGASLAIGLRAAADEIAGIDFHPNARARSLDIAAGLARRLRRMADEAEATATEQCPRSEFDGYGLQCQKPAGHNLCTFEEQPAAGARQDGTQR